MQCVIASRNPSQSVMMPVTLSTTDCAARRGSVLRNCYSGATCVWPLHAPVFLIRLATLKAMRPDDKKEASRKAAVGIVECEDGGVMPAHDCEASVAATMSLRRVWFNSQQQVTSNNYLSSDAKNDE